MKKLIRYILPIVLPGVFAISCLSGKIDYSPPSTYALPTKTILIDKTKEEVWNSLMANVTNSFFVINNIDKSSGFINLSYAGPPCNYIDCGWITSEVSNAKGTRTYYFAGCSEYQKYEIADPKINLLAVANRTMKLEGRINVLVQEEQQSKTRVTTNVRYLVTRTNRIQSQIDHRSQNLNDTIQFDTGGIGISARR